MFKSCINRLIELKSTKSTCHKNDYPFVISDTCEPNNLHILDFRKIGSNNTPSEPAVACLWQHSGQLHIYTVMEDSDVYNTATGKNERTWQTGDVMELFLRPDGIENYVEIHLTPNKKTLELAIPCVAKLTTSPFESLFFDSGMKYQTGLFSQDSIQGWWGHMILTKPLPGMKDCNFSNALFSVCRYNYNHHWEQKDNPEISSTSYYPDGGFHQPEYWQTLAE